MPEHSKKSSRIDEQTTRSTQIKTLYVQGLRYLAGRYEVLIWWRRRELNPRPLVRHYWLYMLRVRLLI